MCPRSSVLQYRVRRTPYCRTFQRLAVENEMIFCQSKSKTKNQKSTVHHMPPGARPNYVATRHKHHRNNSTQTSLRQWFRILSPKSAPRRRQTFVPVHALRRPKNPRGTFLNATCHRCQVVREPRAGALLDLSIFGRRPHVSFETATIPKVPKLFA